MKIHLKFVDTYPSYVRYNNIIFSKSSTLQTYKKFDDINIIEIGMINAVKISSESSLLPTYREDNGTKWISDEICMVGNSVKFIKRIDPSLFDSTSTAQENAVLLNPVETDISGTDIGINLLSLNLNSKFCQIYSFNDLNFHFKISYNEDVKLYVDNKIAELTAAIITE